MAFDLGKRRRVRATINVTPLVDVVLVLLIIFMVLTPMLERRLGLSLPAERVAATAPPPGQQILLELAADGTVRINGQPVPRPQVSGALAQRLATSADKVVFFRADDQAFYDDAVALMDDARGAGASVVGTVLTVPGVPASPAGVRHDSTTNR